MLVVGAKTLKYTTTNSIVGKRIWWLIFIMTHRKSIYKVKYHNLRQLPIDLRYFVTVTIKFPSD